MFKVALSRANVAGPPNRTQRGFLASVISNLLMLLANRRSCNLVSKDKFPKSDCKCELVGFRCLEELG